MIRSLEKLTMKVGYGYLPFATMLVLASAVGANAQAPGSTRGLSSGDGTHTIQGRVFFPSGQSLNGMSVKVNLEATNGEGASTTTDQDGSFRFNSVRADRKSTR